MFAFGVVVVAAWSHDALAANAPIVRLMRWWVMVVMVMTTNDDAHARGWAVKTKPMASNGTDKYN